MPAKAADHSTTSLNVELLSLASQLLQGGASGFGLQAYRQHIARRAMQHVIGGGAQQQCQAVPAMAAHHDQVAGLLLGQVVNLSLIHI